MDPVQDVLSAGLNPQVSLQQSDEHLQIVDSASRSDPPQQLLLLIFLGQFGQIIKVSINIMNCKVTFLGRCHGTTLLVKLADCLRYVSLLKVLYHILFTRLEYLTEDLDEALVLHVVDPLDDAGQQQPNPNMQIALEFATFS